MTSVIIQKLYPFVAKALDKNAKKVHNCIGKFMTDHHELIYDIAPYDRIYYNKSDSDALFEAYGFTEQQVIDILQNAYFWDIPINPQCVKEPYVEVLICTIRYYLKKGNQKEAQLTGIYLAFTGKFYASLHGAFFPVASPSKYKAVMDFVINNMLSDKFDLKKTGTVFGAIDSLVKTWLQKYGPQLKSDINDEKVKNIIQQLRDREKSFIGNIATKYYEAYKNKNYLNYETDDLSEDNFRLTDNDAATAARLTESVVDELTSTKVSIKICNAVKDQNVKAEEIMDIIEAIVGDNNNLPDIRKMVNIIITDFMVNNPNKDIGSVEFVAYTLKSKPNTKNKNLLWMKQTILGWLDKNSPNYRRRKSRAATANSYYKSILGYFTFLINKIARR